MSYGKNLMYNLYKYRADYRAHCTVLSIVRCTLTLYGMYSVPC